MYFVHSAIHAAVRATGTFIVYRKAIAFIVYGKAIE